MAITKIMHMKEDPKYAPQHLINAINYVLDVKNKGKKTDYGRWVGGNVGLHSEEIVQAFLDSKRFWGKEDGRQGYHFVLSFAQDENVDAQTCYNILQEFCEKYLGDSFDYMFAVHTDKEHMHGHIIFNSVNRETGYKYHYKKGDWEKYIQPVTDNICKNYGLKKLTYEKERVGESYASWNSNKKGNVNWTHIMRADIDWAIEQASDMEEFLSI
ncbi:MAG: relaxase/mobilization nuclease domain-containing protein, partial [Agathobacter sp.]